MTEDQIDESKGESFGEVEERIPDESTDSEVVDSKESENTEEVEQEETQETAPSKKSEEAGDDEEDVKLTEKGTKLDPNPKSAVHQELANEKKIRSQMEQVLASPELMAQFMKERYNIEVPTRGAQDSKTEEVTTQPELKEYKPEDFENLDDVAKVVNTLQSSFAAKTKEAEEKIEKLTGVISSLADGGRRQQIASSITKGVESLQKEPELDPKSPDYIEGLEEKIASRFNQLDFDERTQSFKGQYSIDEIGRDFLDAIRMGRKSGSKKAQTIVKDKTPGQIKTGAAVTEDVDEDKSSPEDSIAAGISKMMKGKR